MPRGFISSSNFLFFGLLRVALAIQMSVNGSPKRIAIGEDSLALLRRRSSKTVLVDGKVVFVESFSICDVDGVVVTMGGSMESVSDLTVSATTSSEGSSGFWDWVAERP